MTAESDVPEGTHPAFERSFRAVLVADVVGYTRLMEAAELDTHGRYRTLRVRVGDPTIVFHRGEIVKNTGDGFVAVFESPVDAVRCAAELQREITAHEATQPAERRIIFRMGIHWEPVIFDLNDVYGGGVNIAVRLQTIAPPGGVVVSAALLEQAGDVGALQLEDLGDVRMKNLSRPIHAFSLRLPGLAQTSTLGVPGNPSRWAKLPSVAVLPLTTTDPDESYFSEGFVEDIIVSLSNLPELLVVARGSTMAAHHRLMDPATISEKLGVRYVLGGRVRRSGNSIRLSIELTDVASDCVVWAEKYDAKADEIFSLQDEICLKIVANIANSVHRTEVKRALRKTPENLNAYDYLLRALDLLYRLDFASAMQAKTLLEKACLEDSAYAAPYAFRARWHMLNLAEGWGPDADVEAAEVIRLSNYAIERDPSNTLALALQGHAKGMFYRDYDAALELFERALAISPNSAWAWMFSSATHGFIGDAAGGITRAERAIRLSPLDQQAFANYQRLGMNHYLNGTYEEALRWSRKALSLNPRYAAAIRIVAASLVPLGRIDEARQVSLHHRRVSPNFCVSEYALRCPFSEPQGSLYVERLEAAGMPN